MPISDHNARVGITVSKQLKEIIDLHSEIADISLSKLGQQIINDYYESIGIDNHTSLDDARKILVTLHIEQIEQQLEALRAN